jgi:hypothetical protein
MFVYNIQRPGLRCDNPLQATQPSAVCKTEPITVDVQHRGLPYPPYLTAFGRNEMKEEVKGFLLDKARAAQWTISSHEHLCPSCTINVADQYNSRRR